MSALFLIFVHNPPIACKLTGKKISSVLKIIKLRIWIGKENVCLCATYDIFYYHFYCCPYVLILFVYQTKDLFFNYLHLIFGCFNVFTIIIALSVNNKLISTYVIRSYLSVFYMCVILIQITVV